MRSLRTAQDRTGTVRRFEDLVSHLCASDARYHAAVPAEFLDTNQPPMFITLYFIVTRLPESLPSVRDHFLSLYPTSLTVDLLEQHLLAAETSALAAASASVKRRSGKGKGGKGGGGGSSGGGGGSGSSGGGSSGGGGGGGTSGGSGGSGGGGGGSGGSGGGGGSGTGGGGTGARCAESGGGQHQQQQRRSETQSPQQLREWFLHGASRGSCPYVIRTGDRVGQTCGWLHTQHRCLSRLDNAWRSEFGDNVELSRWAYLLRSRIAIFDLEFDAILSAMYALSISADGDCYRCVPPDPSIAAAALGASEFGTLPGTAPAEALHTFMLDPGTSACFFRDSTTPTPLSTPVPVRLADPSGGPVVARSSTVLPCPAVPSGSLSGLHLPSFSTNLFYHPTSRRIFPSQDVTFDESVPFYRLFPYRSAPPSPPPLFLAPTPPPVDPLLPQGLAPLGVSHVDPLPTPALVQLGAVEPEGVEPGGTASEGAEFGGAEPQGAASSGARTRGTRAVGTGGVEGAGAEDPTESGATVAGGSCAGRVGAGGAGVGGTGAGGAGVGGTGVGGTGARGAGAVDPSGVVRPRPYFVPLHQQPASPLPAPSPYTEQSGNLIERRAPTSQPVSPVRTASCVPCAHPPPVPGTHDLTLCPSSVPLRVHLLAPPKFSLPEVPDPESDRALAASPTKSCLLATAVTDPSFESTAASALVAELLDIAAACHLDYTTAIIAEFESTSPPSVGGECALSTDVLEDRQEDFECLAAAVPRFASMLIAREGDPDAPDIPTPRSYAEAITGPYSSQWQAAMDAEMASWKSTGTYVDEVSPSRVNIVDGMWIFRVKRPSGSPPAFKACYVARGTQWSIRRPIYGLCQAPREWHDTLRTTLAALGFAPSTADPLLFLRTDTSLPSFYVLVYVDGLVFATADTEALTLVKSELQKRHTCTDLECAASGGAASRGAEPGGAESEGAETGGAELWGVETGVAEPGGVAIGGGDLGGAEPEGVEPGGAVSEGAESGGAEPQFASSSGGSAGTLPFLSPQQLRVWFVWRTRLRSGASGGGGAFLARAGGPGVADGAGVTRGTATSGPGGARTRGTGAAGTGGVEVTRAGDLTESGTPGAGGARVRGPGVGGAGAGGAGAVDPGTHAMTLHPSSIPLRVPLPAPPESSLLEVPNPESNRNRAASPTLSHLLATAVTDPSFESAAASTLVAELLEFAAACHLDYVTALVAESAYASPPSVGGECALGWDVLEDRQEDFECLAAAVPCFASMLLAPEGDPDAPDILTLRSYAEAITGSYSSQWLAAMDVEMASWKSTVTYINEVPPPGANIVDGTWIFRRDYELHSLDFSTALMQGSLHEEIWLRRPPGFTGSFPASILRSLRRPVYGLRQAPREWHDTLRTTLAARGFAPSTANPSLFLRTDTSLLPFYVLVYVDDLVFAIADTEALTLVKSELQKRHTCTDLGEMRSYLGLQITQDRARRTITLTQSYMVRQVLLRFGFQFSSPQPTPLSTGRSLSAPPSDESVEPSGQYLELVGCLMYLMTCTRPGLAYPFSLLACYVAPDRHRKVFTEFQDIPALEQHVTAVERYCVGAEVSAAAVEAVAAVAAAGVAEAVEVAEAAEAVVELVAELHRGVVPVVVSASSSSAVLRPPPLSSFVSGTLGISAVEVLAPAPTFSIPETALFPDATEIPRWGDLSRAGVAVFDLDYDAILAAMYALSTSDEGDCYLCVPRDPGIAAAALGAGETAALGASASAAPGAGESVPSGTASAQVFHTFTLDSGASRSFFRDRTTLTPLSRPVAVSLVDPSGGPVLASFSTVLPCPAAPSGSLSGLYLPSFSTNLVSGADLQDQGVDQFTPASQRVTHCTCARTGRHLATFTRRPGSSLYTLSTESPTVSASGQVAASSQVLAAASGSGPESAPCSCRLLSHQTLLWHHRLGHPSLPRLRGMASRVLVSGLSRSLPPLPLGLAPTCVPCVEGRQRAAPHSSEFPPTEAPLQTLHMDVWGPARVRGQGYERYFLLVVDDYSRYTTVFPLRSKGERRIGMVMDVARTSMIHAAAPHFLWPFAVQYAAHQLNLQPRVSLPDTSPTLLWTGKVGDASAFRFYHPTLRRVLSSQDVTFDESVPYYHLFPYRTASLPPPPLFLAPGPPPVDPLPPSGPAPSGVSQVDAVEPVEVAVDSGAATGAEPAGAGSGGAEPGGAESGGAETWGAEPGGAATGGTEPRGAEPGVTEPGGAEPGGAGSARVASRGASSRREVLSPRELREWFARRWSRAAGAGGTPTTTGSGGTGPGGAGAAGPGGTAEAAGVGPTGGSAGVSVGTGAAGSAGPAAAGATGVGAAGGVGAGGSADAGRSEGAGAGAAGAGGAIGAGAPAGSPGAVLAGSGGAQRPRPYFVPLLEQVLGLPPSPSPAPPFECPQPVQSQSLLQPVSLLPAPSPYTGPTGGLAERRAPASRPASPARPACTSRRTCRPRPPAVPGTHQMALRPSTAPLRVPLPSPPTSSLPAFPDRESDSLRAATPTVARFLATVVTDPSLASTAASALVAELVDFAASCRLDYAASLVAESASVCPPSVGGECALSTDVLEDRQEEFQCFAAALPHLVSTLLAPEGDPDAPEIPTPRSYAEAIEGPYSCQWQAAMDAEMPSWKSTGTYVDEVPPSGANIVSGMWILRVKRPPGSPPVFKACYVARGFSQRQGVDYFQTFSPTPKMTTLRVLLHVAAQRDYELHSLDFSTAFLQGSLHEEIWLRRPPGFPGSFPPGTQWSLRRPVYGLCQAPREWHDTLRTTLAALGFAPSTADPSLFLRTDTSLPPFYVLVYVDNLVFATADTAGLAHVNSSCEAEIYAETMAAQELRWLTYLLTDLGEQPRSPQHLYVDNKAIIALRQELRLEHRMKHIALRYFLA
ncbi:unnamed protein product [Closterium sp. NIES-53]